MKYIMHAKYTKYNSHRVFCDHCHEDMCRVISGGFTEDGG